MCGVGVLVGRCCEVDACAWYFWGLLPHRMTVVVVCVVCLGVVVVRGIGLVVVSLVLMGLVVAFAMASASTASVSTSSASTVSVSAAFVSVVIRCAFSVVGGASCTFAFV